MKTNFGIFGLVIVAVLFVFAGKNVQAAPCSYGNTLFNGVSGADLTVSTDCENYAGNDTNTIGISVDPFGITDWVLADKSDGGGNGMLDLVGVVNGSPSGTWSIPDYMGYTTIMLTLKAGNEFAAYLIDTSFNSGEWTTASVFPTNSGSGRDLSHMSLYYSESSLTVVPLPAALPLFAAGLVGLAFLRRFRGN